MQRVFAFVFCVLLAPFVTAQTCDVTYTMDVETADGHDVSTGSGTIYGVPKADVDANLKHSRKVLDALSREQDKGGPYTVEVGEFRVCDGGAQVKIAEGSAMVKGVTLKGANRVARIGLRESDEIVKRYEKRADKGDKAGWDHSKAKKVKRNDLGQKVK